MSDRYAFVLAERRRTLDLLDRRYQEDERLVTARQAATRYVPAAGVLDPLVVFVGEAPDSEEDEAGVPLVGRSGRLLDDLLSRQGIDRVGACWTTNLVRYRPAGDADPAERDVRASLPYLRAEVATLHPPLVATLGRVSTGALWPGMTPITLCHGVARPLWESQVLLPMLHPSYALRGHVDLLAQDIAELVSLILELTA